MSNFAGENVYLLSYFHGQRTEKVAINVLVVCDTTSKAADMTTLENSGYDTADKIYLQNAASGSSLRSETS